MKKITLLIFVLNLFKPVHASDCVVISGLEKDESNSFWEFKDQSLYQGCKIFRSLKDYASTKPENKTIDLRVISHGAIDGSIVCDAGTESPSDVIKSLNLLSGRNKIFASLDSCYSEQVLKEKIVQDKKGSTNQSQKQNLCIYASSAPRRETFVDEKSFADFQFLNKSFLKNKTVFEVYGQTTTGLLSAAPYDEAGLTDYWQGSEIKTLVKPFLIFIEKLPNSYLELPVGRCETLTLATKLNPRQFTELANLISEMAKAEKMHKRTSDQWLALLESFERLSVKKGTKDYFGEWINSDADFGSYREAIKLCEEFYQTEAFCQHLKLNGLDSHTMSFIFNHRKLISLVNTVSINKPRRNELVTSDQFVKYMMHDLKTTQNQFNEESLKLVMGEPGQDEKLNFTIQAPESTKINWSSYLGAFNRLSISRLDIRKWKSQNDKTRFTACEQFSYDSDGNLKVK